MWVEVGAQTMRQNKCSSRQYQPNCPAPSNWLQLLDDLASPLILMLCVFRDPSLSPSFLVFGT